MGVLHFQGYVSVRLIPRRALGPAAIPKLAWHNTSNDWTFTRATITAAVI